MSIFLGLVYESEFEKNQKLKKKLLKNESIYANTFYCFNTDLARTSEPRTNSPCLR